MTVDHNILWAPIEPQSVNVAFSYYKDLQLAPPWVAQSLFGVLTLGIVATLAQLAEVGTGMLFDGASLCKFATQLLSIQSRPCGSLHRRDCDSGGQVFSGLIHVFSSCFF
jgi:hypothetical protein